MPTTTPQFFKTVDLTDVAVTLPSDGELLVYNAATSLYEPSTLDSGDIAEGSNLYFTDERVDDRVNTLLQEGSNITLTYDDGANTLTIAAAAGGATSINDLSDVTITGVSSGELLTFTGSVWENQTLAEAGVAAASHTHAASDTTSGTFADARISESSVTQHEAALSVTESQISDLGTYYESGDTILAADGTSSAPGISFASDTNTGIYKVSNDKLAFVAGGNVGMTHTLQSGLFGITSIDTDFFSIVASVSWGVQAPDVRLFSNSSSTGATLLLFEGSSNGSNSIGFKVDDNISSTVLFNLPSADGSAGEILNTDGSGNLSFIDAATLDFSNLKSGTTQGGAGASAGELWRDTTDNSVKVGV